MRRVLTLCLTALWLIVPLAAQESDDSAMSVNFYTYHQESGNRFVEGQGAFSNNTRPIDYAFDQQPLWLVAGQQTIDSDLPENLLSIQLADNRVVSLNPASGTTNVDFGTHPAVNPIMLYAADNQWRWAGIADNPTNPTRIDDGNVQVAVGANGELQVSPNFDRALRLRIQPDAKIVRSNDGRFAVYTRATDQRYVHGIMGDDLEGASLVVFQITNDDIDILTQIDLENDAVYEGLSPLWADINEDGVQDLITTVSDSRDGSRIRAYLFNDNDIVTVSGQAIGQPNRWQHQLAWGAFGANGEMQLVEVRTPHIGGIVRFYEFDGTNLSIVSQLSGYTSHVIGSRNLDMAVAGDFDGDGQPEIVMPSQDRRRIAGIANTAAGARVVWEVPVGGQVVTNLAATNTPDGLMLAVGRDDGTVRIWMP